MSAAAAAAAPANATDGARQTLRVLASGGALADVLGLGAVDLQAVHNIAYVHYSQGQYAEAERAFGVLSFCDHRQPSYWMGLGAARQLQKNHAGAVLAYSMVAESGGTDPMAPLHAAECYIALGLFTEAVSALDQALDWAGNAPDPVMVVARIEVVSEALEHALRLAEAKGAAAAKETAP